MINKVKIKAAQVDIPGLVGISQGGPSLDELQRITDGINRNSAPQVTFRDSLVEQGDDDNILFAALKKHSGK
tara:strand:+ start:44 stop:259 length:216 start_codon:yes stop_codon:yes gene_type:complete